jgi:hypothetical protein
MYLARGQVGASKTDSLTIWGEWRLVCQLQATTLARIRLDLPGADASGLQDVIKINKQRTGANRRWGREA